MSKILAHGRGAIVARSPPCWRRRKPDDVAAVIFSSGSTGTPKGVMLSHWNLLANVDATAQVYSVDQTDCMLGRAAVLPFVRLYIHAVVPVAERLQSGVSSESHGRQGDRRTCRRTPSTLFLSTPTFCLGYLRKCTREQLGSIRYLLVGAEKLRPALAKSFEEKFGVTPLEGYGCTEMGPVVSVNVSNHERSAYKPGTAGRPLPHVSMRDRRSGNHGPSGRRRNWTAAGEWPQPHARAI